MFLFALSLLSLFTAHSFASPVYVAKDSKVYHHDRNCTELTTTDNLIEFSSPRQSIASGGVVCEHCKPSAVVGEGVLESKKDVDGDNIINKAFIGTQKSNKLNENIEQDVEQPSRPKSPIELSEQTRREIYKEIHYARDRAWSEMPSDSVKRKKLREWYKQKVRQKYSITKDVYKLITIEGAKKGWHIPPFSFDKTQGINALASEESAQTLNEIPLPDDEREKQTFSSDNTQSINTSISDKQDQASKEIPLIEDERKRNQASYSDKTQIREEKFYAFSLLYITIMILIAGLIIGVYIIARKRKREEKPKGGEKV